MPSVHITYPRVYDPVAFFFFIMFHRNINFHGSGQPTGNSEPHDSTTAGSLGGGRTGAKRWETPLQIKTVKKEAVQLGQNLWNWIPILCLWKLVIEFWRGICQYILITYTTCLVTISGHLSWGKYLKMHQSSTQRFSHCLEEKHQKLPKCPVRLVFKEILVHPFIE